MKGQRKKRFLAFILTVVLLTEPGWGQLSGIVDVWASAGSFPESENPAIEEGYLPGAPRENREISGDTISRNVLLDETLSAAGIMGSSLSGNGMFEGEASGGGVYDSSMSGNEILENGEPADTVSGDLVSGDSVSEDTVSGGDVLPGQVSGDSLSDDELGGEQVSENTVSDNGAAGTTDSAKAKTAVCTVVFDSNKGSAVQTQLVQKGARAKKPANPVRSKYVFSGWYQDSKKYNFTDSVTKNLRLTAKWKKVSVGKSQIKKLTNPSKGVLKVKLKKVSGAKGYQVQVSTDKTFKTKKELYLIGGTTASIRDRQKNKTYYVRLRAYKLDSKGGKVYGKFNGRKSLKIKKGIKKVEPSASAGEMKSVALTSKKTIQIKAKVTDYVKSVDSYYYLFHLNCSEGSVPEGARPDAKIKKTTNITLKTSLDYNTPSSKLQSKFVLAVKTKKPGSYTLISTPQFISNPEKLADYNYAFPKASTKKGLQVNPAYLNDAVELGVKHTAYNICLDDLIATPEQKNEAAGIPFSYNGTTYWFNRGIVEGIDHTLERYHQNQMIVSAILLLRWREDISYLIPSAARAPGHGYYALNTSGDRARNHWEAVFTFLAQRYTPNRWISNWILGNEVNNYKTYHYTGSTALANNVKLYVNAYRLAYIAIRSVYGKARVYISLDQVWTYLAAGSHTGKQFLEKFANNWNTYGDMGAFHIAFHPYPAPLEDPAFWTNSRNLAADHINSPCISMQNLKVFTDYVRQKWGSGTRIILSEQGFTSKRYGVDVPQLQAAAIAYAYYLAEFNDSVDAFILHRHVDHQAEQAMGLYLGLWSNDGDNSNPATAGTKKYAWDVFQKMDTSKGKSATKFALTYIGASSWKSIVPGYDAGRF